MSRVGKIPIDLPSDVEVNIDKREVTINGPKGKLHQRLPIGISITLKNNTIVVSRSSDSRIHRSLHGLSRSLLANMVEGVTKGCEKDLEIVGVGYRVENMTDRLVIRVGLSHPVEVFPLPGISFSTEGVNRIKVCGINKQVVGEMAARIRAIRPPDAYKGKGIRYFGEHVRLKAGKTGKAIGKKG